MTLSGGPSDPTLASKSSQYCHAVHTSGFTAQQGGTERRGKKNLLSLQTTWSGENLTSQMKA